MIKYWTNAKLRRKQKQTGKLIVWLHNQGNPFMDVVYALQHIDDEIKRRAAASRDWAKWMVT